MVLRKLSSVDRYNKEHLSRMHPRLVPDCNNGGVTQSGLKPGKSYTNMCIDETAAINSRD